MRMFKRAMALCLAALILMMTAAQAEAPFLVHSKGWDLDAVPAEVTLKAAVSTHMPFDDERLATLTPITDMLSLHLVTGADEGKVTIGIGGEDALSLQYRGNGVQLSSMPEVTYTAEKNAMALLLGEEVSSSGLYEALNLSPDGESLVTDGLYVLAAFPACFEAQSKKSQNTTNISGYGRAAYKLDFSFTANKAKTLQDGLLEICPEGWLKEIIAGLTFSGKQSVRMYFTKDDVMLRMEYNGSCGPQDNLRTVKLVVRTRHDGEMDKDYIELTSPAKKGKNKNNLTFERTGSTDKNGAKTLVGSYKYTVTAGEVTSTWSGKFDLKNAFSESADVLSGEATFETKLNGAEKVSAVTIVPNVTIAGSQEAPLITGTVDIAEKYAGRVTEQAVVSIDFKRAEPLEWTDRVRTVDLSMLKPEELLTVQQEAAASVAAALVRPLILALGKDAAWFFRDLPEEAVQAILDGAAE